jgi:hypothetical protein
LQSDVALAFGFTNDCNSNQRTIWQPNVDAHPGPLYGSDQRNSDQHADGSAVVETNRITNHCEPNHRTSHNRANHVTVHCAIPWAIDGSNHHRRIPGYPS